MVLKPWILPLVVCVVAGAVVGVGIGLSGVSDDLDEVAGPVAVVAEPVAFFQCPEEGPFGNFHGGDRVYATARDASSVWIEVRAPFALDTRVWVVRDAVEPDASFESLPVRPCRWEIPAAYEIFAEPPTLEPEPTEPEPVPLPSEPTEPEPVPDPLPPEPEPGPLRPEPEPEPVPGPRPPEPEPPPPDTNPPVVAAITAAPNDIWERGCISPVSVIRVLVEDDEGVAEAYLSWSVGSASGSTPMSLDGGDFAAEIGDFAARTIDPDGPGSEPVVLTIVATDTSGNTTIATDSGVLVLHLCD